jgi:2',3'-cyclic-nucleotide 2'-phosphodiesterase (5'-nucleotidase family)
MVVLLHVLRLAFATSIVSACSSCEGGVKTSVYPRFTRRMQPESLDTTTQPKGPLNWGEINFIHTSDSHGWLEGHIKERNYGADWGDFVSFVKHMQDKAANKSVDLLLIDTGGSSL